jgi:fatty-acyl-CoA synthase
MPQHFFIADQRLSIARGLPLADEAGLGALTLPGFLRQVTSRFAGREAIAGQRADGAIARWTYGELWDRSVAVAKALIAGGLGQGERVGVLMTNRAEFLSAVFGTALAGGVAAPLSTFSTAPEIDHLLASSACSVLLLERQVLKKDFAAILSELEPEIARAAPGALVSRRYPFLRQLAMVDSAAPLGAIETWADFLAGGADIATARVEARAACVRPADPGVLFFSSGTTGKPKGILSAQRGVTIQMWRMAPQQGLASDVRYWTANGFFWSGNFAMALGAPLAAGGTLVLQRTFDPAAALRLMAAEQVDFLFAWPHQWAQLMDAPEWLSTDLSALKYIDGESPIASHPTVRANWIQPTHCYGNTETFTLSTGYPAGTTRAAAANSHGLPLPGNTVKIVDPLTSRVVPVGEPGEIAIKGPTLMLGYLGIPLDQSLDDEGFFRTGDGGHLDAQGRLHWQGRLNDIIKTGGANVSPIEVDDLLQTIPGVKIAKTVGVPDELLGELVVACIVAQDGITLAEDAIRSFAKARLASYKVPRRVLFLSEAELATTGSAKVKTADLRKLAAARLEESASQL